MNTTFPAKVRSNGLVISHDILLFLYLCFCLIHLFEVGVVGKGWCAPISCEKYFSENVIPVVSFVFCWQLCWVFFARSLSNKPDQTPPTQFWWRRLAEVLAVIHKILFYILLCKNIIVKYIWNQPKPSRHSHIWEAGVSQCLAHVYQVPYLSWMC